MERREKVKGDKKEEEVKRKGSSELEPVIKQGIGHRHCCG